jgi:branched-subunit amino acid ABC-type transport system permease component
MVNVAQLLVNILITGSLYALMAVGLTMIYRILRFANFAHAELITFGAYVAYSLNKLGFSLYSSLLFAFFAAGALAIAFDYTVFKPLRDRGADAISLMIASIGAGLVVRHVLQEIYGAQIASYTLSLKSYEIFGARISQVQMGIIIFAVAAILAFHLILTRTKLGKAMRATSDNPTLAMASGVSVDRVILATWFLGGGIAGVAGVFRAADTRLIPTLGWEVLLPVFAVVLLGGIGSFYGAIVAAYIIAIAENVGVLILASLGLHTGYRPAIAFLILILVLIFRPQGIFGTRLGGERE